MWSDGLCKVCVQKQTKMHNIIRISAQKCAIDIYIAPICLVDIRKCAQYALLCTLAQNARFRREDRHCCRVLPSLSCIHLSLSCIPSFPFHQCFHPCQMWVMVASLPCLPKHCFKLLEASYQTISMLGACHDSTFLGKHHHFFQEQDDNISDA